MWWWYMRWLPLMNFSSTRQAIMLISMRTIISSSFFCTRPRLVDRNVYNDTEKFGNETFIFYNGAVITQIFSRNSSYWIICHWIFFFSWLVPLHLIDCWLNTPWHIKLPFIIPKPEENEEEEEGEKFIFITVIELTRSELCQRDLVEAVNTC